MARETVNGTSPDAAGIKSPIALPIKSTLGPGRSAGVYFLSITGANSGIPGQAATSIARCSRAPARIAAIPYTPNPETTNCGMILARATSMIARYASRDRTRAPKKLWAMPPCVNKYRDGSLSKMRGKNMSTSRITAPRMQNGIMGVSPVAEKRM